MNNTDGMLSHVYDVFIHVRNNNMHAATWCKNKPLEDRELPQVPCLRSQTGTRAPGTSPGWACGTLGAPASWKGSGQGSPWSIELWFITSLAVRAWLFVLLFPVTVQDACCCEARKTCVPGCRRVVGWHRSWREHIRRFFCLRDEGLFL